MGKKVREPRQQGLAVTGVPTPGDNERESAQSAVPSHHEEQAAVERPVWVPVQDIIVPENHRSLDEAKVQGLMASIRTLGQGQAGHGLLVYPTITPDRRLVFGGHRLQAVKNLGWPTVPCWVLGLDDLLRRLATLDENWMRAELSVLERAEHLAERSEILRQLGLRRQAGRQPDTDTVSGPQSRSTEEVAADAGISGRTLQRYERIFRDIPADLRRRLHGTDVEDSTTQLLRVAALDEDGKRRLADKLAGGVASVGQELDELEANTERQRQVAGELVRDADHPEDQDLEESNAGVPAAAEPPQESTPATASGPTQRGRETPLAEAANGERNPEAAPAVTSPQQAGEGEGAVLDRGGTQVLEEQPPGEPSPLEGTADPIPGGSSATAVSSAAPEEEGGVGQGGHSQGVQATRDHKKTKKPVVEKPTGNPSAEAGGKPLSPKQQLAACLYGEGDRIDDQVARKLLVDEPDLLRVAEEVVSQVRGGSPPSAALAETAWLTRDALAERARAWQGRGDGHDARIDPGGTLVVRWSDGGERAYPCCTLRIDGGVVALWPADALPVPAAEQHLELREEA